MSKLSWLISLPRISYVFEIVQHRGLKWVESRRKMMLKPECCRDRWTSISSIFFFPAVPLVARWTSTTFNFFKFLFCKAYLSLHRVQCFERQFNNSKCKILEPNLMSSLLRIVLEAVLQFSSCTNKLIVKIT